MILRVSSTAGQNRNRCAPIPVDWLGSGVPGTKSQGKGRVQPGYRTAVFEGDFLSVGISHDKGKKTPKQSWNKRCGDSGDN